VSDYTKTTDFAAKDALTTGDPNKVVVGTEIDDEFNAIATAVATKANIASPTFTGTVTFANLIGASGATVTAVLDEDTMTSNSATALATQQSIKAYVDTQLTGSDLDFQADSGGALSIDLDSETMTFTGGTGIDTTGSLNDVTFAIDSTVATLADAQTFTNKTLTSPVLTTPQINDTSADHQYVFAVNELSADRTVTLPLLTGADEFVFKDHTVTLTNKTIDLGSNTLTGSIAEFDAALQSDTFVFNSEIGTDVQAYDAVLDDLSALSPVADNEFIVGTGAGTYAHESGATARTSLGVAIGTDVQAFDAVLDDLSALSVVADNEFIVGTGAGTYAHESGATARTSMGLGTGDSVTFNNVSDTLGELRQLPTPDAAKTGSYSLDTGDVGVAVEVGSGGSITIPNSTFSADDIVSVYNKSGGDITITCSITTCDLDGSDVATITLGDDGMAVIYFQSGTACTVFGRNLS